MFVGNIQLYFFLGIQIDTEIWIDVDNGTILEGTKNFFYYHSLIYQIIFFRDFIDFLKYKVYFPSDLLSIYILI